MTFDEAMSKAVVGYKVRHAGMKPDAYIDYNFEGWKLNGKAWHWNDEDTSANWEVIGHQIDDGNNWDIGAAIDEIVDDEPISIIKTGSFNAHA